MPAGRKQQLHKFLSPVLAAWDRDWLTRHWLLNVSWDISLLRRRALGTILRFRVHRLWTLEGRLAKNNNRGPLGWVSW